MFCLLHKGLDVLLLNETVWFWAPRALHHWLVNVFLLLFPKFLHHYNCFFFLLKYFQAVSSLSWPCKLFSYAFFLSCRFCSTKCSPAFIPPFFFSAAFFHPVSADKGEHVATTSVVSKGQGKAPLWECVTPPWVFKTLSHLMPNLLWPCFTVQVGYKAGQ